MVLASSSPPPARERGGEAGAASSDLPIGCFYPAQGGSCHGNTGRLPVPLLAVWATFLGWKALRGTAFFRSDQIWWVGWRGGWVPQTSAKAHSPHFWTEGKWRGLSELLLLARGVEILLSCQTDLSRGNESSKSRPTPGTWNDPAGIPPPFPSLLLLARFSFPDQVLTFVLEI